MLKIVNNIAVKTINIVAENSIIDKKTREKKPTVPWWQKSENKLPDFKGKPKSWAALKRVYPAGSGRNPLHILCPSEGTTDALCPVLGFWVQENQGASRESSQWKATKIIRMLEHFPFEEKLRDLGLCITEKTERILTMLIHV